MKSRDELQNAFRKAFDDHKGPLNDSQWERLNKDLRENNKRPARFWLGKFFVALSLILFGLLLGFFLNNKEQVVAKDTEHISKEAPALSENPEQHLNSDEVSGEHGKRNSAVIKKENSVNATEQPKANALFDPAIKQQTARNASTHQNQSDLSEKLGSDKENKDKSELTEVSALALEEAIGSVRSDTSVEQVLDITVVQNSNDSTKKNSKPASNAADKKPADVRNYRMAISVASGFAAISSGIIRAEGEDRMHEDSRELYTQSESDRKARYFNLGLELYLNKNINLILNSGLHYRSYSSKESVDYKLNRIPFRDNDGVVIGYFNIHDTMDPMVFRNASVLRSTYLQVPLRLAYLIKAGKNFDIIPSFGIQISKFISAGGNTLSLNNARLQSYKGSISHRTRIGYMAGIQTCLPLYGPFWTGLEFQWQQNFIQRMESYGSFTSKVNQYNFNFLLKYKF